MPTRRIAGILIGLLLAVSGAPAQAQWVEPPGTGWLDLSIAHQDTPHRYDRQGNVVDFDTRDARSITTTVRLTGALGLIRGVDAWVDVPYHRFAFNDVQRDRLQTGVADPRLFLRAGPSLVGGDGLPMALALRGGVKFPVAEFPVDADIIPISDGQRDWELLVEVGKSLHPWPMYAAGWVGYRWREKKGPGRVNPGDERFFTVTLGGTVRAFRWKVVVDGTFGMSPTQFGIELENGKRELVQVVPTVGWKVGPGAIEVGARLPVHGRRVTAGPTVTLGYFLTWDQPFWE